MGSFKVYVTKASAKNVICGWEPPCSFFFQRTITRTGLSKASPDWIKLLLSHSLRAWWWDWRNEIARVKLGKEETDAEGGRLTLCGEGLSDWWCWWRMGLPKVRRATWGVLSSIAIIARAACSPWPPPPTGIPSFSQRSRTHSWKRWHGPSQKIPQTEYWKSVRQRTAMVVVLEHLWLDFVQC